MEVENSRKHDVGGWRRRRDRRKWSGSSLDIAGECDELKTERVTSSD